MIYLRTGLPGASKTLNSLRELVLSQDEGRPFFYNNIKLLMLDMDVSNSFSGWFYGWYFPRLRDAGQKRKLIKIMKPIHDEGEFVCLNDVPWLKTQFECHNHFDTWLYWVERVYPKNQLKKLSNVLDCVDRSSLSIDELFDMCKPLNLHFTHFDNPAFWFDLPKRSVILIDECQQFFPPRPVGSKVPQAIAKLETHRHGGYDIHFITQDATLADQNLRKLVGRHIHFYNPFGGKRVTRYENPQVFDPKNYHDKKQAKKKPTAHATNFYGVYWSAEIHTHKFQFPKILLVAVFTILMVVLGLWYVVDMIRDKQTVVESAPSVDQSSVSDPLLLPSELQIESSGEPVTSPETEVIKNVDNPLTETYSTDVHADLVSNPLKDYLDSLTKDVYISGTVTVWAKRGLLYDYSFYRNTDQSVFYPSDVGLVIEPIDRCLANVKLGDLVRLITCDPFYKRVPVQDERRLDTNKYKGKKEWL